jgi:hypothetical protein
MRKMRHGGFVKTALMLATAAAGLGIAAPAMAHDRDGWGRGRYYDGRVEASNIGFNIDILFGSRERRPEPACEPARVERVWVEPVYRTVCDRVWVPAEYRTVCDRVWREPIVEDRCERVWCEPVYKTVKDVKIIGMTRYIVERRVLVSPGHWDEVHRKVVVAPGHWENVERQELVCDAHWKTVERQELVSAGHWEERTVAAPIPARPWDNYDRGYLRYGGCARVSPSPLRGRAGVGG